MVVFNLAHIGRFQEKELYLGKFFLKLHFTFDGEEKKFRPISHS